MEINYIIQAHKNPGQVRRLIDRLNGEGVYFFIHIDAKADIVPFEQAFLGLENIHLLAERVNVLWGDISQVEATLLSINKILEDQREGYCVLLSGQDYVLRPSAELGSFLDQHAEMNFISMIPMTPTYPWPKGYQRINQYNYHPRNEGVRVLSAWSIWDKGFYSKNNFRSIYYWLKRGNYMILFKMFIKRNFPSHVKPFAGSQWWALPVSSIRLIQSFLEKNPGYLEYHKYSHVPDEIFFHSILGSLLEQSKIRNSLTYVNWHRKGVRLPVVFDHADLDELLEQKECFFARKFDVDKDDQILDMLDKHVLDK